MMGKIYLESSSALLTLQTEKKEKLVLAGRDFKWMTPDEIKAQNGKGIVDSLADLAKKLGNAELIVEGEKASDNLLINLTLLDRKIKRHNNSIESNGFLYFLDIFLSIVTFGSFSLKYHSLSKQVHNKEKDCTQSFNGNSQYLSSILKKYSEKPDLLSDLPALGKAIVECLATKPPLDDISHLLKIYPYLPKETRSSILPYFGVDILLEANDRTFNEYVKAEEFNGKIQYNELEKVGKLLSRLDASGDKIIKDKVMSKLKAEIHSFLPSRTRIFDQYRNIPIGFPEPLGSFINELIEEEKTKIALREEILTKSLAEVKDFIFKNFDLMKSIGSFSKKDPQVLKINASDPYKTLKVRYNYSTGGIVVNYGQIGAGTYKVVKKIMTSFFYQMLAVGKQRLGVVHPEEKRLAEKEVQMMEKLKGLPYVLQLHLAYIYHSTRKGEVMLTMTEYCNMGDLQNHMKSLKKEEKLAVAKGMIRGVLEAHKAEIIHRDLKPQNFFLKRVIHDNAQEEIIPVLGDFGLACWTEGDPDIDLPSGPFLYRAPEVESKQAKASFASDAWSMGVTFTKLFGTGEFDGVNEYEIRLVWKELRSKPEPSNKESIEYVIWKLLRQNVAERMNLEEALAILERLLA